MSNERQQYLTDECWALISRYFPEQQGNKGFPSVIDNRTAFEAIVYRFRVGCPWRDLPESFGKWDTIYQRFRRWSESGVIEDALKIVYFLQGLDVSVVGIDSTVCRAHRHAAGARKIEGEQGLGYSKGGTQQKYTLSVQMKIRQFPSLLPLDKTQTAPLGQPC